MFAIGHSANAQIVHNGDFGAGSPSTPTTTVLDWTVTGATGQVYLDQTGSYSGLQAYSGNASDYLLDLTGGVDGPSGSLSLGTAFPQYGEISQTLTGLTSGDDYLVSFALGNWSAYDYNGNLPGIQVAATVGSSTTYEDFKASPVGNGDYNLWNYEDTFEFTADASGTAALSLTGFAYDPDGGGLPTSSIAYIGLDDVQVTDAGPSVPAGNGVPDSGSTLIVFSVALAGLVLNRKFRGQPA